MLWKTFIRTYCRIYWIATPNGVYSFFNGLALDNLFSHGVACQCVKLQLLASLGFEAVFVPFEITVLAEQEEWEGIRRQYWYGCNTYYLPHVTWKATDETTTSSSTEGEEEKTKAVASGQENDDNRTNVKRQKVNES
jgi:protein arginine N-methyltransferase 2